MNRGKVVVRHVELPQPNILPASYRLKQCHCLLISKANLDLDKAVVKMMSKVRCNTQIISSKVESTNLLNDDLLNLCHSPRQERWIH